MSASSIVIWMTSLTLSLCAIILSAAAGMPQFLMSMSGFISLAFALLAIREYRMLLNAGASASKIGSSTAHYMGLVWIWGALALLVTYYFILRWHEWWVFFLTFAAVGVLCLFIAATLGRDADRGRDDATMLTLTRYLAIGQLIGMVIAMVGMLVDPSKSFLNVQRPDWAANNIFFFGAFALAAISLHALVSAPAVDASEKATTKAA